MKKFIAYLPLTALFVIGITLSFAQQNQNTQKPNSEIDALKKRILTLERKLQTVENVEKIELEAKFADAQTKLLNAEIDKYTGKLKDTNDEWLRTWSLWFIGIISFFVVILLGVSGVFWFWLRYRADQLIANEVEKSLSGFEAAVDKVNILQDQIRILEKERAASMLEATFQPDFGSELGFPKENEARREEALKELSEEALLNIFGDKKYHLAVRHKAAEVLTRKSPPLVSPLLELLNLAIDPDSDITTEIGQNRLRSSVALLVGIEAPEVYEGLMQFLNRLLIESPEHKDLFLTWTVFTLAYIGDELNKGDSIPILRGAIPHLAVIIHDDQALRDLAEHFGRFNEPEGIKDILTNGLTDGMPDVETRCLELLQNHNPEFVEKWKAKKEATNTQNEES